MANFSVLTAFWIIKTSQVKERSKEEKQAKLRKQRTAAAVFLRTFGALSEVQFLHSIYHFKAQEVKNPTLQTVYNSELKWGRYGLRKTTASSHGNTISQGDFLHGAKFGHFAPWRTTLRNFARWLFTLRNLDPSSFHFTAGSPRYFAWFLAL